MRTFGASLGGGTLCCNFCVIILDSIMLPKMNEPTFEEIISIENLFSAWQEFMCGKKYKKDVMEFSVHLSESIYDLHRDLKTKAYNHGGYTAFNISDPKPR